jgi:carboxypeptidase Q
MRTPKTIFFACAAALVVTTTTFAAETVDLSVVHKIKQEAFENSQVMDHMFYLTDVNGPRLTGSPGYEKAANWAAKKLKDIGAENSHLEKWGPFGKGWTYDRFSMHMIEPSYSPISGFPMAWSKGTNGVLNAEPIIAVLSATSTDEEKAKFKGKLQGKMVLLDSPREVRLHLTADGRRYSEADLAEQAMSLDPTPVAPGGFPATAAARARAGGPVNREQLAERRRKFHQFLLDEGVAAVLTNGYNGDGGTVFASSAGGREEKDVLPPPYLAITPEHYNRIYRLVDKKIPVKLELEVKAQQIEDKKDSWNVIAEIPGGKKKDEIVMIGAHLDSWHGGTGATDNAAGSSVMIEVIRILKTLNVKMDRTVRIALWSGEEQGLLGSKAYAKEHFADPSTMKPTTEHGKIAGYFNLDNGSGKIRGIYLQGNDMVRPVFEEYLKPFADLGAKTITIRNTGGTDHLSFNEIGLPGFQFIQDPLEYNTRNHHSNYDVYDYIQKSDLMQASAIIASFVYNTANRDEMLPRKPLPKPVRPRGQQPEAKKSAASGGL